MSIIIERKIIEFKDQWFNYITGLRSLDSMLSKAEREELDMIIVNLKELVTVASFKIKGE